MGWVAAKTLVLHRSVWLWTVAYFMLRNPEALYKNIVTVAVGHHLPQVYDFGSTYEGLTALLLALSGLQDFLILFQENYLDFLRVLVPGRLVVLFAMAIASYMEWPPLAVGPIFTLLFLDCVVNCFIFSAVREEQNENAKVVIRESRGTAPEVL